MSPSDELVRLWARVDTHLRAALATVDIDPTARATVVEFLDHNELGLAFATLAEALLANAETVGQEPLAHLEAAAAEMDLLDDPSWLTLKRSARPATDESRRLELSDSEVIVLNGLLSDLTSRDDFEHLIPNAADQQALHNLVCILEREDAAAIASDYDVRLAQARQEVLGEEHPA